MYIEYKRRLRTLLNLIVTRNNETIKRGNVISFSLNMSNINKIHCQRAKQQITHINRGLSAPTI